MRKTRKSGSYRRVQGSPVIIRDVADALDGHAPPIMSAAPVWTASVDAAGDAIHHPTAEIEATVAPVIVTAAIRLNAPAGVVSHAGVTVKTAIAITEMTAAFHLSAGIGPVGDNAQAKVTAARRVPIAAVR